MSRVQPIPEGFHSLTPYLYIRNAADAIEFYKRAFGAKERYRLPGPDQKSIGHAELQIGNSIFMISDENPEWGHKSPQTLDGSPIGLALYVTDCDDTFQRAVGAGASSKRPPRDEFWGDRAGSVTDPFGFEWMILTHQEDLEPDEIQRRASEAFEKMTAQKT
jgi:PhnB protein